jgi:PIN domain nuclease of toxin-antitoxin system
MSDISILQTYFLDASAIVKLVINEPGSARVRELLELSGGVLHTSWVLVAEAMGVLKRFWLKKTINDHQYNDAIFELFSLIRAGHLDPVDLAIHDGSPRLVTYAFNFIEMRTKYPRLDAGDLLQFSAIREGYLNHLAGESRPRLVTAGRGLRDAAAAEGISIEFANSD